MNRPARIAVALAAALGIGLGAAGSAQAAAYAYAYDYVTHFSLGFAFAGTPTATVNGQSASTYNPGIGSAPPYPNESHLSVGNDVASSFSGYGTRAPENFFGNQALVPPFPNGGPYGPWYYNDPSSPGFGRADALMDPALPATSKTWAINNAEALANGPGKHSDASGQSLNSMTVNFVGGSTVGCATDPGTGLCINQALTADFDYQALMQVWLAGNGQSGSYANAAIEFTFTLSELVGGVWRTIDHYSPDALNQSISVTADDPVLNQQYLPGVGANGAANNPATGHVSWTSLNIDQGDTYKLVVSMKESASAANIPEPATAFLAGLGLLGVAASRRSRK